MARAAAAIRGSFRGLGGSGCGANRTLVPAAALFREPVLLHRVRDRAARRPAGLAKQPARRRLRGSQISRSAGSRRDPAAPRTVPRRRGKADLRRRGNARADLPGGRGASEARLGARLLLDCASVAGAPGLTPAATLST